VTSPAVADAGFVHLSCPARQSRRTCLGWQSRRLATVATESSCGMSTGSLIILPSLDCLRTCLVSRRLVSCPAMARQTSGYGPPCPSPRPAVESIGLARVTFPAHPHWPSAGAAQPSPDRRTDSQKTSNCCQTDIRAHHPVWHHCRLHESALPRLPHSIRARVYY